MTAEPSNSSIEESNASETQVTPAIDWGSVNIPEAKARKINQSGWLSAKDYVWLKVVSHLLKKTVAQVLQTAVLTYLRRNFTEHLQILDFIANREGLSREELIEKIYREEIDL